MIIFLRTLLVIASVAVSGCAGLPISVSGAGPERLPAAAVADEFVGKRWSALPKSEFPSPSLALSWNTKTRFELREYQPVRGRFVVTVIERVAPRDHDQDVILAALDVRAIVPADPRSDIYESHTSDCAEPLMNRNALIVGLIIQDRGRPAKKFTPVKAWRIDSASLKFVETDRSLVECVLKDYAF
jgi:hypothetical protein